MYSAIISSFHHGMNGARISVKCFDMPGKSYDYPHHVKLGEDAHAYCVRLWLETMKCPATVRTKGSKERPRVMRGAVLTPGRYVWLVEAASGIEGPHEGTYPVGPELSLHANLARP